MDSPVYWQCREADQHTTLYYGRSIEVCIRFWSECAGPKLRLLGQTPSITQTGTGLVIKNDKGEVAAAKLTSDITISAGGPLNSYGVIRSDHAIDWSNGNTWRKQ